MPTPSTSTNPSEDRQIFNDDLLTNPTDLAFAVSQFPRVVHILDYPRLREKFRVYEALANRARDKVRVLGATTLVFATLSLLALVTHPLRHDPSALLHPEISSTHWVELLFELGGMVAAIIAVNGMLLGPWKRRWLESRLMTERLRQWHFQLAVRRGEQVEASCADSTAEDAFKKLRDLWFDDFLKIHEGKLLSQLEQVVGEQSEAQSWLHEPPTFYDLHGEVFSSLCKAFSHLRFFHQHSYAVYKLRKAGNEPFWRFLRWPSSRQLSLLSGAFGFCFVTTLVLSLALIYNHTFAAFNGVEAFPSEAELWCRTGAIATAVVGISLKTLQEGLAPEREIERYNDYRARTHHLQERFLHTRDPKEKMHLMEELELAAVDEMRSFLRTHQNATFLLA